MAVPSIMMNQLYLNGYEIFADSDQPGKFAFYNRRSGEGSEVLYESHEKAAAVAFTTMRKNRSDLIR